MAQVSVALALLIPLSTRLTVFFELCSFMGSGVFCIKACDPSVANSAQYCDNIYDRIGCQYNVPAAYVDNVFESCAGELQDPYVANFCSFVERLY